MKLIYYSLSVAGNFSDKKRIHQLMSSVQSLRNHNSKIRVQLHLLGELPETTLEKLQSLHVHVIKFNSYSGIIEQHLPGTGDWLGHYPVMHKFLTMETLKKFNPSQVLYLDSDTYIHTDIDQLFEKYNKADIYAREEPGSRQSPMGYHPDYLNEDSLYQLETQLGCDIVKPFNTGVLLMNNNVWQKLLGLSREYLEFIAGFSLWMVSKGFHNASLPDLAYLEKNKTRLIDSISMIQPLSFPGSNLWIKEQVALWLTVGKLGNTTTAFFHLDDVLQGCEELQAPGKFKEPVISHYFSQNTRPFLDAVTSARYPTLYHSNNETL